jgi:drug/metabolite transporter superfamily protein YnfA
MTVVAFGTPPTVSLVLITRKNLPERWKRGRHFLDSETRPMQHLIHGIIFLAAACLEVGGDAVVRQGLKGGGLVFVLVGAALLGVYGIVVNTVDLDFSRLLGIYVAVFALVSVLAGRFYFHESIAGTTWLGLAIIIAGGLVIQFGPIIGAKLPSGG